jgi:glycosidase
MSKSKSKIVIYQVLPRLFGNTKRDWVPWGTKDQNGIGKFSDFTDKALRELKNLGITHIWLTGILHHALIGDYKAYGISDDDPDVVKGRAGSPYAIKDYYAVNPDLAKDPARRNEEFRELVDRIHHHELKVIIDLVPNHVARKYESLFKPEGIQDLGQNDDKSVEYNRNNNFYYIPGHSFEVPDFPANFQPLGGESHPLLDGLFEEIPAKWTGNGSRSPKPSLNDWYETVKLNYGVRPDGSWDFNTVPEEMRKQDPAKFLEFWKDKSIPDTWEKMKDIALYWLEYKVDGFRFDMAEMVPVPFWNFLNAHIKRKTPDALCIAEIYQPHHYSEYIDLGLMDYLYDKVDLYDTLRDIICGHKDCHSIFPAFDQHYSISQNLLHFLENHDEHRIASSDFAGDPNDAKAAMVLSATIGKGAVMIYNGQEVGEKAEFDAGFGSKGRTSIFDYIGIPKHQAWMNNGTFDGAMLSKKELELREFYQKLLWFSSTDPALEGHYYDLHRFNNDLDKGYPGSEVYAFARWKDEDKLLILCHFSKYSAPSFRFYLYPDLIRIWELEDGIHYFEDYFTKSEHALHIHGNEAYIDIKLKTLQSLILKKTQKK